MRMITAALQSDAAGTLHLPLPAELRYSKVKVTAVIQPAPDKADGPSQEEALAALRRLREMGTFKSITDPVAWQREIRKDRPLPGRS